MLKTNQMLAFNEVMLTGSISQAARHLHRTQSSVSATIATIEDSLQMKLFERRNGRLYPVPEAYYLQKECEEIMRRIASVSENMHRLRSLQTGEINIASMPGPSVFFLPELLSGLTENNPRIRTNMVSRSSEGVYRLVAGQRYDIGLADFDPKASSENPLLDTEVFALSCVCAVSASHPLAQNSEASPEDLARFPVAMLGEEQALAKEIADTFARHGVELRVQHTTQYFLSLMTYAASSSCCAIIDPIAAKSASDHMEFGTALKFIPIVPEITYKIALLSPRERPSSALADHFRQTLVGSLKQLANSKNA